MNNDITKGNLLKAMIRFSVPYLIACFLQSFYGMADLFITGQFNGAASVTAVSIGSQVTHMLTAIITGLVMGSTVSISHSVGADDKKLTAKYIGNSISLFAVFAAILTALTLLSVNGILSVLSTPVESLYEARRYLLICFAGLPFITAYNVISGVFRGLGDTKRPMIFVAIAGVINVVLDYILIGPLKMGAAGAALATITAQAMSVIMALVSVRKMNTGIKISRRDVGFEGAICSKLLKIGGPIALQDGLIQVSFLVITMIANSRGLAVSAAVGIVEKFISFLFLVPSAMLSTVSAITAQNAGAGKHSRGRKTLRYGIIISVTFGCIVCLICQFIPEAIVSLFVKNEPEVVKLGGQYLRTYTLDCIFAGFAFCFSGYFSAYGKSLYSFVHNIISIILVRIPGAYLASVLYPATLYQMGLASPGGSLLSSIICAVLFTRFSKKNRHMLYNSEE